jgi:hypothetical protein
MGIPDTSIIASTERMLGTFGLLAVLAAPGLVGAQATASVTALTLPWTEVYSIHSDATGTDYKLFVALPESYDANTDARYPVVYALDAGLSSFAFAYGDLRILVSGKEAREASLSGSGTTLSPLVSSLPGVRRS